MSPTGWSRVTSSPVAIAGSSGATSAPPMRTATGELSYLLGDERGSVQLDSEYLEVTLSPSGTAADVTIAD
jgi:hypothetical protein